MMNLSEYRRTAARLADFLPWAALVGPGVIVNKDGSFQRTARFRGPDLDSAVAAELVAVSGRINNAFRRLGSGWSIFVEAQRSEAATYPDSTFPDPASGLVDEERKADFEEAGIHFVSDYFLTILYLPPAEDAARAETWLYEGREQSGVDPQEVMRGFIDRTDRVLALLDGFMPECGWLDDTETLTYLHSTVSTKRHRVRVPETPVYLDALLADQPLTGGLEPRLGDQHLRVLTVIGFPTATTPGLLDDLNRLAFPYRWSTRAILLDKTDATKLLTKIRRQWFAKRKSIAAILKEVLTNEASALVDTDASNKAADADLALQELGADVAGMAYVTATIVVWDADPRVADEKLRLVEKVIQGRDFTAMVEGVNAVDAWLGSLPGHAYANVRQPPISTLNLAHMIPLSAVWAGPERDEHFGAPPLLYGKTEGSTPFRLSLHVGDVGHTLVVGPTGAGKSVLLALMALQFRRYENSQVFAFDFGGSIRAAALAMGGDWHDLGGGLTEGDEFSVSLQPLARIHDTYERAWLKTLRKKNASVIFATQSLSDIDNSSIAPAIIESCPTRLLLPNERAIEPQITAIYRRFGLNDRQIEILARATPKRDYYCQSRRGNRLFELGLSELGLALCAASSKSDQTLIANLVAERGRDGFLAAWLRARDVGWAIDLIPTFPTAAKES
jgi:type IV secretion system protein VirB4